MRSVGSLKKKTPATPEQTGDQTPVEEPKIVNEVVKEPTEEPTQPTVSADVQAREALKTAIGNLAFYREKSQLPSQSMQENINKQLELARIVLSSDKESIDTLKLITMRVNDYTQQIMSLLEAEKTARKAIDDITPYATSEKLEKSTREEIVKQNR